jgi:hypothetical protein
MKWLWQNGCAWPNNFNCFCLFSPSLVGGNQCRKITTRMTRHRSQVCRCSFMTVVMKLLLLVLFLFVFFCFFWKFILNFHRSVTDSKFIDSSLPIWSTDKNANIHYQFSMNQKLLIRLKMKKKKNLMADLMSFIVCHFSFSSLLFPTRDSFWWDIITAATNRWIWFANYTHNNSAQSVLHTWLFLSFELLKVILWRSMDIALDDGWMDG